jgi:ribonuclease HI
LILIYADGGTLNNDSPNKNDRKGYASFLPKNGSTRHTYALGNVTNNEAEYYSLIKALKYIKSIKNEKDFIILMDSQLVIKQMSGTWKCKNKQLRPLYLEAVKFLKEMETEKTIIIGWIDNKKMKSEIGH